MKPITMFCMLFMPVLALFSATAFAEDQNERLNKLEESLKSQQQTIEQQQKTIDTLKTQVDQKSDQGPPAAASIPSSPKASGLFGGSAFTNPNISLILDTFYYASNLTNDELANQGYPALPRRGRTSATGSTSIRWNFSSFPPSTPISTYTRISRLQKTGSALKRRTSSPHRVPRDGRSRAASSKAISAGSTASILMPGTSGI